MLALERLVLLSTLILYCVRISVVYEVLNEVSGLRTRVLLSVGNEGFLFFTVIPDDRGTIPSFAISSSYERETKSQNK